MFADSRNISFMLKQFKPLVWGMVFAFYDSPILQPRKATISEQGPASLARTFWTGLPIMTLHFYPLHSVGRFTHSIRDAPQREKCFFTHHVSDIPSILQRRSGVNWCKAPRSLLNPLCASSPSGTSRHKQAESCCNDDRKRIV